MTPSRFWSAAEFTCKTVRAFVKGVGAPTLPGPLDDGDLLAQAEEANEVLPPWWSRCAVEAKAAKTGRVVRTLGADERDAVWQFRTTDPERRSNGWLYDWRDGQWGVRGADGAEPWLMCGPDDVVGHHGRFFETPADVAGATSDPADRGTPPRGVEEAPRGADSTPVDVDEVVAYRLYCRTCNNQLTGLMPTALRARQAFEEKGGRCRICNPVSVLPDAIGGPW